jgi:electron transfer flavoprotein alpha subunit
LDIDPETKYLKQTRPAFGGNIMATILDYPNYRPQMSTVRPKVFAMPPRDDTRKGEIIKETLQMTEDQIRTKVLEFMKGAETVNLADAEIIVSGGRGVGGPEGFKHVRELAQALGAAVGASCSRRLGLIPYEHQSVKPVERFGPRSILLWISRFDSASGWDEDLGCHCRH